MKSVKILTFLSFLPTRSPLLSLLSLLLFWPSLSSATKLNKFEKAVLMDLKVGLRGKATNGWNFDLRNCTQFKGVKCNELGRITELVLPGQGLNGFLRPSIGNLTFLNVLDLHKNNISGEIPWTIIKCKTLSNLDLSINGFKGEIPRLDKLNKLWILNLHANKLRGSIPEKLGDMDKLQTLDLSKNHLSGPVPTSISELKNLQFLFLNNNYLTGSLPVVRSTQLFVVNLSNNLFTGSLVLDFPSSFVMSADFSSNFLSGPVTVTHAGDKFCPVGKLSGSGIKQNCIGEKVFPTGCRKAEQRRERECEEFCGMGQKGGVCGGKGVCVGRKGGGGGGGGFYCECVVGYEVKGGSGGNWTCVKETKRNL